MMSRTMRVVLLLMVLAVAGGYAYIQWKAKGAPASSGAMQGIVAALTGEAAPAEAETGAGGAKAEGPQLDQAKVLALPTRQDLHPLPGNLRPLAAAVAIPPKRMPVVYLAPVRGADDEQTSAADQVDNQLRFQLRAATSQTVGLNMLPAEALRMPYFQSYSPSTYYKQQRGAYLEDARKLGADYCVLARVTAETTTPQVRVEVTNLETSSVETWQTPEAPGDGANLLGDVAAACARMCGLQEEKIAALKIGETGVNERLWQRLTTRNPDELTTPIIGQLAGEHPNCRLLYVEGGDTSDPMRLHHEALARWPDDLRIMCSYASELFAAGKPSASLAVRSAVISQAPDYFYGYYYLTWHLEKTFPYGENAQLLSPVHTALVEQQRLLLEAYPKNWFFSYQYSLACSQLATVLRGSHTVDKIPDEIWTQRAVALEDAVKAAELALVRRPDSARVIWQVVESNFDAGNTDMDWQREMIAKVHAVDARNTAVEWRAMVSHSAGWGRARDFLVLADEAIAYHKGDPKALVDIAEILSVGLMRMVSFKQMSHEQAYEKDNPFATRILKVVEEVYGAGLRIPEAYYDEKIYELLKNHGKTELLQQVTDAGLNVAATYAKADECMTKSKFEECMAASRMVMEHGRDEVRLLRAHYYLIKSLWKLKRYEESMEASRVAMKRFPDKQMAYYMFAVVAEEAGLNIEEAYGHAYRAVEIEQTNQGCNETFEKLRQRLGKGAHPKLG